MKGFGACTLADMQLRSLLLMQVFTTLGSISLRVNGDGVVFFHMPELPSVSALVRHMGIGPSVDRLPVIDNLSLQGVVSHV